MVTTNPNPTPQDDADIVYVVELYLSDRAIAVAAIEVIYSDEFGSGFGHGGFGQVPLGG